MVDYDNPRLQEAATLLRKNGIIEILEELKKECTDFLIATDMEEKDKREEWYRQIKMLDYLGSQIIALDETKQRVEKQKEANKGRSGHYG